MSRRQLVNLDEPQGCSAAMAERDQTGLRSGTPEAGQPRTPPQARRCTGCGKTNGCDAYGGNVRIGVGYWHFRCLMRARKKNRGSAHTKRSGTPERRRGV